jgi:hypothetical protein
MNYFALCLIGFAMLASSVSAKDEAVQALNDAQSFARAGDYAKALERHEWYHANALRISPAQYGVRLSFALSYWKNLGDKYPPALASLTALRDNGTQTVLAGTAAPELFHDVVSINRTLGQSGKSVELFKTLDQKQPELARRCLRNVEEALISAGEMELFMKCGGDPVSLLKKKIGLHQIVAGQISARPGSERSIKSFEDNLVKLTLSLSDFAAKKGDEETSAKLKQMAAKIISDPRLTK